MTPHRRRPTLCTRRGREEVTELSEPSGRRPGARGCQQNVCTRMSQRPSASRGREGSVPSGGSRSLTRGRQSGPLNDAENRVGTPGRVVA